MSENPTASGSTAEVTGPQMEIDPEKARVFKQQIESEQSLLMGILGGAIAAVVGAGIWAAVTVATNYQIGWMAVGVGFIVGYAVRILGKGVSNSFGIAGAVLALVGCLLGNLMSVCGFLAAEESASFVRVCFAVLQHPDVALELLKATFSPMDLLFYGIAVYEGYRFSFRRIAPEEIASIARKE